MSTIGSSHQPPAGSGSLARHALELFGRFGYDAVTTAQIAHAAGVTQRTFFRHFPTKADVFVAGMEERQSRFVERLYSQPPALSLLDALRASIAADETEHTWSTDDAIRVRVFRESEALLGTLRAYEARFEQTFVAWIAQRTQRPESNLEVRVAAAVLVAMRRVVVQEWQTNNASTPVIEIANTALAGLDLLLE